MTIPQIVTDTDWDAVMASAEKDDQVLRNEHGDFVAMPDGSQRYITMPLLFWWTLMTMIDEGTPVEMVVDDSLNAMSKHNSTTDEDFNFHFSVCVHAYGLRREELLEEGPPA